MRGNIFSRNGEDAFAKLGYIADMGAGSFYFVAQRSSPTDPTFPTPTATTAPACSLPPEC